jgi:hypothetical protein
LRLAGQGGVRVVAGLAWPLAALFQLCGLRRAAAFFAMH